MSFTAYPQYREELRGWVPKLPMNWRLTQLRHVARIFAGGTPDRANPEFWSNGTVPWLNSGSVNDWIIVSPSEWISEVAASGGGTRRVPAKSVLVALAGQGKTKGMAARLEIMSTCNQSMAAIVPSRELEYRFLQFWLSANYQNVRNLAGGDLRDGLNLQHIGGIYTPIPPFEEQVSIANYLDRETAEIDAFIADQEELIAHLGERRTALRESIISAATHSGHSISLKRVANITVGIVITPSAWYVPVGIPALRGLNVQEGSIEQKDLIQISEDGHHLHQKSKLRHGDVVIVRTGQAGTAAFVPAGMDGWNAIDLLIARPKRELSGRYLEILLNSETVQGQIKAGSVGAIQGHFNVGALKNLFLPVPSLETQHDIVARWNDERGLIDAAIADAHQAIKLSKERRAAVISAAVTGKIDVRELMLPASTIKMGAESIGVA